MAINIYDISEEVEDKLVDLIVSQFKETVEEVLVAEEDLYARMMRLWNDGDRDIEVALAEPGKEWTELGAFLDPEFSYFEAEIVSSGEMDRVVLAKVLCSNDSSEDPEDYHCIQFVWFP